MQNTSLLSCEHIRIRRVPGRTDGFIRQLQEYLKTLFRLSDAFGSAELHLQADGDERTFLWLGDEHPEIDLAAIDALAEASQIDVRVDLCSERPCMEDARDRLTALLASGTLKDCVRYCELLEDEHTSSLFLSGLYRGAFLHGSVPFTANDEDILEDAVWNGYTHRAEFHFAEESVEAMLDLADRIQDRIEEIDLELSDDDRRLEIGSVQLACREDVSFYREALEQLVRLSDHAQLTGALTPESDAIFALLRFVREGSAVVAQTAVAERKIKRTKE